MYRVLLICSSSAFTSSSSVVPPAHLALSTAHTASAKSVRAVWPVKTCCGALCQLPMSAQGS